VTDIRKALLKSDEVDRGRAATKQQNACLAVLDGPRSKQEVELAKLRAEVASLKAAAACPPPKPRVAVPPPSAALSVSVAPTPAARRVPPPKPTATPSPSVDVWKWTEDKPLCNNCALKPVDNGNGLGLGKHLHRDCSEKKQPRPLRGPPQGAGAGGVDPAKHTAPRPATAKAASPGVSWADSVIPALALGVSTAIPDNEKYARDFPERFDGAYLSMYAAAESNPGPGPATGDVPTLAISTGDSSPWSGTYVPSGYSNGGFTPALSVRVAPSTATPTTFPPTVAAYTAEPPPPAPRPPLVAVAAAAAATTVAVAASAATSVQAVAAAAAAAATTASEVTTVTTVANAAPQATARPAVATAAGAGPAAAAGPPPHTLPATSPPSASPSSPPSTPPPPPSTPPSPSALAPAQHPPPIYLAHASPSDLTAPTSPPPSPPPGFAECAVPGCENDRYDDGMALCCSRRCTAVYNALVTPPFCAIPDCKAPVFIDLGLKIVRHYCCIEHAHLDTSRGTFTFACDGPDAPHGVSSCVLATCSKIPTNGSEFCCIAHAYTVVPSVLPSVAPMADAAAATVDAVATAATVSMASLRTSLAELQVELEAHRSEYDDLLRRQAGAPSPPSPPQSCPSTREYFSSTEPIRPPPPPRGLVSANTRSATAATSAHAVAATATASAHAVAAAAATAAATASDVTTAAAVTTVATAAPQATARPAVAAAATAAAGPVAAADDDRPSAASTHPTDPAVANVATTAAVAAAPVAGRRKRFIRGYVYTAKDIAKNVLLVTLVKREAPSSHTRAMSAIMGTEPSPPPSAPPSSASSPEPSRPSTPSDLPPPPAPPARLLEPLPAFPRPPAPATYAARNWWAAAGRVRGDMRDRIVELKRAIVQLEDHDDRLRWAMVMHTTINRIAAH